MNRKFLNNNFFCLILACCYILISCKNGKNGTNGTNGKNGGGTTLISAITSTCTSGASGTISPPTFVPSVLSANNVSSLSCASSLNNNVSWADYDLWVCNTNAANNAYYEQNETFGVVFNWPSDGNILPPSTSTNGAGTIVSGQTFYCSTACIANYTDGTSAYILLLATGTCQ